MGSEKTFEIWSEGYCATGESAPAQKLVDKDGSSLWSGRNFNDACKNALIKLGWDMNYYDKKSNSYWACGFFDNEKDARKTFG